MSERGDEMKYKVVETFIDKNTGKTVYEGEEIDCGSKRAKELGKLIEPVKETEEE